MSKPKPTYEELEDPYIARNGKILDPTEFFLINGTDELVDKLGNGSSEAKNDAEEGGLLNWANSMRLPAGS